MLLLHLVKNRIHGLLLSQRRLQFLLRRLVLPHQIVHLGVRLPKQPAQLKVAFTNATMS